MADAWNVFVLLRAVILVNSANFLNVRIRLFDLNLFDSGFTDHRYFPLSTKFQGNSLIFAFEEFKYFNVTYVGRGNSSFAMCTNLEKINVENVKTLHGDTGNNASNGSPFVGTKIVELYLPNLINTTNNYAFKAGTNNSNGNLRRVTIGDKLQSLNGSYALAYANYVSWKIYTATPPTGSELYTHGNGTRYIYVPDESVELYKEASNFTRWKNNIKPISECPW